MKKIYRNFVFASFYLLSIFTVVNFNQSKNFIAIEPAEEIVIGQPEDLDILSTENLFEIEVNNDETYWNTSEITKEDVIHIEGTLTTTEYGEKIYNDDYSTWKKMFARFYFHEQSREELILSDELNLSLIKEGSLRSYDCIITINGDETSSKGQIDLQWDGIDMGVNEFTIDFRLSESQMDDFKTDVTNYHLSLITNYMDLDLIDYYYIDEDLNAIENPHFERDLDSLDLLWPTVDVVPPAPIIDKNDLTWLWILLGFILFIIIIGSTTLIFFKKNK